ncbi:MAG: SDR family oxidoreductase [Thermohalobaculum sp.]|nr:SDR family oxidoreductase [Thermohalobaculum sp.]
MGREHILVTGVSRGIGRAIATRLADDGFTVIGISRRPVPHFRGIHRAVDLAAPDAREALAAIAADFAPLRLIANAGVVEAAPLDGVTSDQFAHAMRVNIESVIWAMQALAPAMRAAGFGRIVTLGSRAALGKAERAVYSASKAGVAGLTRSMALELAPHGITVNCVAPGPIDTEMFAENQPEGSPARAALVARVPLGRMGAPEEVAAAVAFLASDQAGYITGQTLYVCGGYSVGGGT